MPSRFPGMRKLCRRPIPPASVRGLRIRMRACLTNREGRIVRRKTVKAVQLTGQHAAYALQMLIEDGKIASRDVIQALKRREKTVRELRARLMALGDDVSKAVVRAANASNGSARVQRARKQITKAQRTAR